MLHRFATFLAGCTVLLVLAGSLVTSTGSGLSVPDWPTTYGWNMLTFPPSMWVGGIFYEHTHRLIATTVATLAVGAGLLIAFARKRRARGQGEPDDARSSLLEELALLERAHATGAVGIRTCERARRELIDALALLLASHARS